MYRCVNNLFDYCSGVPEWGKSPKELGPGLYPAGGSCKLDPKTCEKHQTLREQLDARINQLTREETGKPKRQKRARTGTRS